MSSAAGGCGGVQVVGGREGDWWRGVRSGGECWRLTLRAERTLAFRLRLVVGEVSRSLGGGGGVFAEDAKKDDVFEVGGDVWKSAGVVCGGGSVGPNEKTGGARSGGSYSKTLRRGMLSGGVRAGVRGGVSAGGGVTFQLAWKTSLREPLGLISGGGAACIATILWSVSLEDASC